MPRLRTHLAYRLLTWAWPSLLMGFAAPGLLLLLAGARTPDDLVLTAKAVGALQQLGLITLIGSAALRLALWPPRKLRRLLSNS